MSNHGEQIGFEVLRRACGCMKEFPLYRPDPYREARREKFLRKRCFDCGRKASDEHNATQKAVKPSGRVKKGQEPNLLPAGATVVIQRQDDLSWRGSLTAEGLAVETTSGGSMGIVSKLARKWLSLRGAKLSGQVKE